MLLFEKEGLKQKDNSTRSNSENDFKELDNEINKVIRGEASLEEENLSTKTIGSSPIHKEEKKIIQKKSNKTIFKEKNKEINKKNILEFQYKNQQRNSAHVEEYKKNLILSLINSDKNFLNNNLNFTHSTNNSLYMYNIISNIQYNEINNNLMDNGNNMNYLNNSIYNNNNFSYLNELIYLYNQKLNGCNNNTNNLNCFNINTNVNNTCTNNNVNTMNVNNIPLLNILNCQLNDFQLKNIQENNINSNIMSNLNIMPNDYINNNIINNTVNNNTNEDLLSMQMKMQLVNNNINEFNQNIFLINQINNQNILNNLNNNLNLMNNQSQFDLNFHNNNNININNQIKQSNKDIQNNSFRFSQEKLNNLKQNNEKKNFNGKGISNKDILNSKNIDINGNAYKRRNNKNLGLDINKNIINLMDIFLCKDLRTTLMIKNIPNKYTISSFLDEINTYFKFTYDIFYLPIDYVNKCNLGFAFINFVEPFHIILFHELYSGKKWKKFNSDKICELLYAKFQGKKELIRHFEKGKVLLFESEEKRPLILATPNPLPKINLPYYFFDLFIKIYPHISYEIKDCKIVKKKDNGKNICNSQISTIFSINGNFNMN